MYTLDYTVVDFPSLSKQNLGPLKTAVSALDNENEVR